MPDFDTLFHRGLTSQTLGQWHAYIFDTLYVQAVVLAKLGLVFFLFTQILQRIPDLEERKNFRLVHTERPFFKREFLSELCFPLFNWGFVIPLSTVAQYLFFDRVLGVYIPHQPLAWAIQKLPTAVQVVVGLFVLDLALYIRHRFVHHFLWPYHTIHHAAREVTFLTWARLHPGDAFVMGLINTVVLFVLGFSGEAFALSAALLGHINQFNHSNIRLDYGWPLRYLFVSPNMHRWHHAADDPKAINKNFCIVFAFIDLAFGTYYVPKDRLPGEYGVCDEHGEQVVGTGYFEQMAYPFVHHWRTVKKWLGRGEPPVLESSAEDARAPHGD